jgi:hypothetical protein
VVSDEHGAWWHLVVLQRCLGLYANYSLSSRGPAATRNPEGLAEKNLAPNRRAANGCWEIMARNLQSEEYLVVVCAIVVVVVLLVSLRCLFLDTY